MTLDLKRLLQMTWQPAPFISLWPEACRSMSCLSILGYCPPICFHPFLLLLTILYSFFSYCYQDGFFQDPHHPVDHGGATNDKQLSSCLETLSEHHTILCLIVLGYSPPISFRFSLSFFHLPPYFTRLYWKALLILF